MIFLYLCAAIWILSDCFTFLLMKDTKPKNINAQSIK